MTQTILIFALLGIFLCLVYLIVLLRRISVTLTAGNALTTMVRDEIRELRLTSRARVSQVAFGKAPNDSGVEIVRAGRAARSKRVIAGGDASSDQFRDLQERIGADNEPDLSGE